LSFKNNIFYYYMSIGIISEIDAIIARLDALKPEINKHCGAWDHANHKMVSIPKQVEQIKYNSGRFKVTHDFSDGNEGAKGGKVKKTRKHKRTNKKSKRRY